MPFVQGKCESCGGILAVDSTLKAANCPFCGVAYVVQDSINYYNTSINVENLHANVVNISDESSAEGRLKAAEAYMKLKRFDKAESEYKKVIELTPQNYYGWLGLIEAKTNKYSKRVISMTEIKDLEDYAMSVVTFAPDNTGETLLEEFREYISSESEKNKKEIDDIDNMISDQDSLLRKLNEDINSLGKKLEETKIRIIKLEKYFEAYQSSHKLIVFWGVGLFLVLIGAIILYFLILTAIYMKSAAPIRSYIFCFLFFSLGSMFIFFAIKRMLRNRQSRKEYNTLCHEEINLENEITRTTEKRNAIFISLSNTRKKRNIYL